MKIKILTSLVVGAWFTVFSFVVYCKLRPYTIFEPRVDKFAVGKDEYMVGETLDYELDFCKYGDYKADVTFEFLSEGVVYATAYTENQFDEGCYKLTSYSVKIPDIPEGTYHLRILRTYRPNPFREIHSTTRTEDFRVRKNPDDEVQATEELQLPGEPPAMIGARRPGSTQPTRPPAGTTTPQPSNSQQQPANVENNNNVNIAGSSGQNQQPPQNTPQPTPPPSLRDRVVDVIEIIL